MPPRLADDGRVRRRPDGSAVDGRRTAVARRRRRRGYGDVDVDPVQLRQRALDLIDRDAAVQSTWSSVSMSLWWMARSCSNPMVATSARTSARALGGRATWLAVVAFQRQVTGHEVPRHIGHRALPGVRVGRSRTIASVTVTPSMTMPWAWLTCVRWARTSSRPSAGRSMRATRARSSMSMLSSEVAAGSRSSVVRAGSKV